MYAYTYVCIYVCTVFVFYDIDIFEEYHLPSFFIIGIFKNWDIIHIPYDSPFKSVQFSEFLYSHKIVQPII